MAPVGRRSMGCFGPKNNPYCFIFGAAKYQRPSMFPPGQSQPGAALSQDDRFVVVLSLPF